MTHLRFARRRSSPPFSFGKRAKLGDLVGDKGWDVDAGAKPDPEVVARLVAEPVAGLLRDHTKDGLLQAVCGTGRWWYAATVSRARPNSSTSWRR